MNIVLYGKEDCFHCDKATWFYENLLKHKGYTLRYVTFTSENRVYLEELIGKVVKTLPQIFVDDEYVGGCKEFIEWIDQL